MKRALGFAAAVLLAASPAPAEERPFDMSNGSCTGRSGTRRLTVSPMRYRDIGLVLPYGLMIGGHVTPIDHMYLSPADVSLGRDVYDVRAIADATIVSVGTRAHDGAHEYRLVFEHSCSFWSYFDLVTSLAPHVLRAMRWTAGREGYWSGRIPVEAGETIGRIGGQTLDFGVYNAELLLPGFVKPAHYVVEDWKVHTDDPFLYFRPAVRDRLLALDVREAEPRAGRIDHDVDGRLRGNWFREGTGFYEGTCERGYGGCDYWGGHLAFAPDGIDPTHLRVSVGDWAGEATQFGVGGNGPDPVEVSPETGPAAYELVRWTYVTGTGEPWDGWTYASGVHPVNNDWIEGVLLVEMTGRRRLRVEAFPGKTAAEVTGFTAAASVYTR